MAEDEGTHKCVLCDRILESKEALQLHFRRHASKEIDNKGISSRSKLSKKNKKEQPVIKNGKNCSVACDVCGQEFAKNTLAIQHKFRKHPEVLDKYFCPYCGMQFTIKALFDKHVDTHGSDERKSISISIKCEDCDAEFYFQSAKEYHQKSTHKRVMTIFRPVATAPPSKKIRMNNAGEIQSVYYCHLCGSEYIIKFNLQQHLEKDHTEQERCTVPQDLIRCTTCDALFYTQKAYETHNVGHKPDDLYVTSEQQRLQTVSRVDQDFDIRRVLPLAVKYIPSFKSKPKTGNLDIVVKDESSGFVKEEQLSPPSTPEPSESDSDSDVPLIKLAQKKQN